MNDDGWSLSIIDQRRLPHALVTARLESLDDAARAIRDMQVRGAPLIGATAAYGVCLGVRADASDGALEAALGRLAETRPTAVNLRWALDEMKACLGPLAPGDRAPAAYGRAARICEDDVDMCSAIGDHGLALIRQAWEKKGGSGTVDVLTHCNAGWLATVDWGTALAPIYKAHDAGIGVHVWVDETRPRNQGAGLTAWELLQHGVDHTVIVDNAGGHLHAARPRRPVHHGHRPHHQKRRRVQQDRHLPEGAGGARHRGAVLRGASLADHRLDAVRRRRGHPHRGARRIRGDAHRRAHRRRRGGPGDADTGTAAPPPTTPST